MGDTEILCSFKLVLEGKTDKEMPESSRLEFLGTEENTTGPLNRRDIADLPLLRTLLAIRQNSQEPSFWEVMDSFVLLAYASLEASRTLLQRLLSCLNLEAEAADLEFKSARF